MTTRRQIRRDAERLWRLCLVKGSLEEERVRHVAALIAASGHRGAPAVLSHFLRLLKLDRERSTARVESAAPLDQGTRAAVEAQLARKYGRAITTAFAVEPRLIGGMRVKIGSDVYDGTVKAGLDALEARL